MSTADTRRLSPTPVVETPEQRLRREAEMIAEAWADAAAGRVVSLEAVEAWVESWYTDHELPPPAAGQ